VDGDGEDILDNLASYAKCAEGLGLMGENFATKWLPGLFSQGQS